MFCSCTLGTRKPTCQYNFTLKNYDLGIVTTGNLLSFGRTILKCILTFFLSASEESIQDPLSSFIIVPPPPWPTHGLLV